MSGFSSHSSEIQLNHSNAFLKLVTVFSKIFLSCLMLLRNTQASSKLV